MKLQAAGVLAPRRAGARPHGRLPRPDPGFLRRVGPHPALARTLAGHGLRTSTLKGKRCHSPSALMPGSGETRAGQARLILLIMGHAYGADMWHRTAPELAASYRVIRFDNRGIGRGSDPPGPYPVQLMADNALAVLDAAGAASAHIYGVWMGGFIALQLALDHPGRVPVLTLGCTAASAEGASRGALLTRVRSLVPAAALNRIAWKLLYGPGTPSGRRAEDQQIVRRTRASGRGRRGQLTGAASFDVTGGWRRSVFRRWSFTGQRTASSPPPALSDSLTASREPGWWSSRTPVAFYPPTPPMPPTRGVALPWRYP